MNLLLVGNYGVGNLGDEALKEYFLNTFPEHNWEVISANPSSNNEYYRLPAGIRSFFRFKWIKTLTVLWKSDAVVFGGGSLFTDSESSLACVIWGIHAFFAYIFGKKIIFAFQGIGPLKKHRSKLITRWVLRRSSFISVRDEVSFNLAKTMVKNKKIIQSFDPIYSAVVREEYDLRAQKVFIAIPRNNSDATFENHLTNLLKSGRWEEVNILSLQPENNTEKRFCESLKKLINLPTKIIPVRSLDNLSKEVSKGSFILSQRYHGALIALAFGRELKVVQQRENDKLSSIQKIIDEIPLSLRREELSRRVNEGEGNFKQFLKTQDSRLK
ncbi:MAG: polysaccharide pyruvyl transferase family protein [Candidatus Peribacteraceae bacterium]|nr:polysaccharide pyruvyl transferase family protein [Candidatus Peribacteraceae bacterium]